MEKQNPVYIKVEYGNSLKYQRDLLSTEVFFLNLVTLRKKLNLMKEQEILIKTKIKKSLDKMENSLKRIDTTLPKVRIPNKKKAETDKFFYEEKEDEIDIQLKEIQEKLNALSA
jgi:hypothetical protein